MANDWTPLYKKYKGKWVALAEDEKTVIAVGATAKEAFLVAKKKTNITPFLTPVPKKIAPYAETYQA